MLISMIASVWFGNGYGNFGYTTLFDLQRESGRRRFAIQLCRTDEYFTGSGLFQESRGGSITTPTSPRYLGTTKDGLWSGKLMAYIPDAKKNTHFVEMNWQERKIDGIEYLQKRETDGEEGEYNKRITKVSALPTKLKR